MYIGEAYLKTLGSFNNGAIDSAFFNTTDTKCNKLPR